MDWKARFEVSTVVSLSEAPPLGSTSYVNGVNSVVCVSACSDPTVCSFQPFDRNTDLYANPEV